MLLEFSQQIVEGYEFVLVKGETQIHFFRLEFFGQNYHNGVGVLSSST